MIVWLISSTNKGMIVWWISLGYIVVRTSAVNLGHGHSGGFTVQPGSLVQAEGLKAVFECLYTSSSGAVVTYEWFINGVPHGQNNQYVMAQFPSSDSPASLMIVAVPKYNNTVIECEAAIRNGTERIPELSSQATFTVVIHGIEELKLESNGILSWHTLLPSITTFYVDVAEIGSTTVTELVESVLVNCSSYSFSSLSNNACDVYTFIVIPTDGANNGTFNRSVTGYSLNRKDNVRVHCQHLQAELECSATFDSILDCTCVLAFSTKDSVELPAINENVTVYGTGIANYDFQPIAIRPNRKYLVETKIYKNGHAIPLSHQTLTTHDIVNATVNECSNTGALNISCEFVSNTKARGYLAIVSTRNCKGRINDTIFYIEYNVAGTYNTLNGAGEGSYNVIFYDLENDSLPVRSGVDDLYIGAASIQTIDIYGGKRETSLHESIFVLKDASVECHGNMVCVYCPSEDCLALIYNCAVPDILISFLITSQEGYLRCIELKDGLYSVAFFRRENSSLDRYPGKQMSFTVNASDPTTGRATILATSTSGEPNHTEARLTIIIVATVPVIFAAIIGCVLVLVGCWFKKKKLESVKVNPTAKDESTFRPFSLSSGERELSGIGTEQNIEVLGAEQKSTDQFIVLEPTYALADARRIMVKKSTADKELVDGTATHSPYVEVAGHQHETQIYTHVVPIRTFHQAPRSPGEIDESQVEYAVLNHEKLVVPKLDEVEEPHKKVTPPTTPPKPTPLNIDTLHAILTPAADKWYELGLVMGFSQDTLEDEIYLGNSTNWLRLREVCGLYCQYKHSWEEVVHILWKVEEWEIADSICRQEKLDVKCPETRSTFTLPLLPPKPPEN